MNAVTKIEPATLASAMAAAFGEIEAATKDAKNPHFKSKYADLTAVIGAIKPALVKNGLFFTQNPEPHENGVQIETFLHHSEGQSVSLGKLFVPANKKDAQGFGSALTYARRYALVTAFGVPTEDDDGNAAVKSQPKVAMATDDQITKIQAYCQAMGGNTLQQICEAKKVGSLPELNAQDAQGVIRTLEQRAAKASQKETVDA